ncbi:MAG: diguanylate cyclase domain-containing protein [Methylovirgula sp.]
MTKIVDVPRTEEDPQTALPNGTLSGGLLEQLVTPAFALDPLGRVILWNRACERLTGIEAAQLLGTSDHWRGFYKFQRPCLADVIVQDRTSELPTLYTQEVRCNQAQKSLHTENWCFMPQTGRRLYLAFDAGPVYDEAGHMIAVVETLRDMTANKVTQGVLQDLASRDGLTGLANRRRFDETLRKEWLRATRNHEMLSLLMIDIDNFKHYNDAEGHQAGDECLNIVACAIAGRMRRPSDVAARYGGEEFGVILPATTLAGARAVADEIRSVVAELNVTFGSSGSGNRVTVSIGVAADLPTADGDPTSLVARADAALYRAKCEGRNRVIADDLDAVECVDDNAEIVSRFATQTKR